MSAVESFRGPNRPKQSRPISRISSGRRVFVSWPSPNNLRCSRSTTAEACIEIARKAVSDSNGHAQFFTENLTGRNATFIENYAHLGGTRRSAPVNETCTAIEETALDAFFAERGITPDFIRIDIEGPRWPRGMSTVLASHHPNHSRRRRGHGPDAASRPRRLG